MVSKCMTCGSAATPVWDRATRSFKTKYQVCRSCAESGKAEYWTLPFSYVELFKQKGLSFAEVHPLMPEAFRETQRGQIPSERIRAAFDWEPSDKPGLLLHGTTGGGKTRAAWFVFNRIWLRDYPKQAEFMQMRKVDKAIEKGFDERSHGSVLEYLIEVPLLALDDLGKEKLTARVEADLFAIIDERTSNRRTTIITTNYNGAGLEARFTNAETGPAFVRRLKEFFTIIAA